MLTRVIDITRPLTTSSPVWPGDVPFVRGWISPPGRDAAAVSWMRLSPHVGTHIDAPLHLDPVGRDVASLPLLTCIGRCEVVALPGHDQAIDIGDLPPGWNPSTPRVLFATGSWPVGSPIPPSFASLTTAFVDFLARAGVALVGLDTPSVDSLWATDLPVHRRCVERSVLILEGLDLSGVTPGAYTLVAVPLRLVGFEASPVRALLLPARTLATGITERAGSVGPTD
ncbi:MAG: cyclase family protein [Acidobacteriia bacterium]|nr:cyclase family protein [Terriglobia bacterium]